VENKTEVMQHVLKNAVNFLVAQIYKMYFNYVLCMHSHTWSQIF